MLKLLISLLLICAFQNCCKGSLHWGQHKQNWPFPEQQPQAVNSAAQQFPTASSSSSSQNKFLLNQVPLQSTQQNNGQPTAAPWNDYNEYLSKLSEYYNDYYSEYGSRYNEYLAKFSEWMKSSFGISVANNGGNGNGAATIGSSMPPDWMLPPPMPQQPGSPTKNAFHRHRSVCPPKPFPPQNKGNKTESANKGSESRSNRPLVLPIIHGNFTARANRGAANSTDPAHQHLAMHSSVTLVVDNDAEGNRHIIVVDTGLAVMKHAIITGLIANGVQPQQVDTVCITHPDTDTMGNLNLFPCAEVHSGNAISRENLFAPQSPPLFESNRSELPFRHLFANTELFLTPGMSFQDQSLLMRNVPDLGTVAIVGKLILNESDLENNLAIREFVVEDTEHRKLWQATRREIVCMADYIVPGYGTPFKVSAEVKRLAECGAIGKKKLENTAFALSAFRKKKVT